MPEVKPAEIQSTAVIKVVGVGGAGGAAINRMKDTGIRGVEFIAINTDAQALRHSKADVKIHIGKDTTRGLGAGADPKVGEAAASESVDEIKKSLEGSDMAFITFGAGGGTGSGAAPIVSQVARDLGVLTVGVVTRPFSFEGDKRRRNAEYGIGNISRTVDTLITIPNDRLLQTIDRRTPLLETFKIADDVLRQGVQGISELITENGLINLDFADVDTVLRGGGVAVINTGYAEGEDRMTLAIQEALNSPLLNNNNISKARQLLINVYYDDKAPLTVDEFSQIHEFTSEFSDEVNTIHGISRKEGLGTKLGVTILASGFGFDEDIFIPKTVKKRDPLTKINEDKERDEQHRLIERIYGEHATKRTKAEPVALSINELDDEELIIILEETPSFRRDHRIFESKRVDKSSNRAIRINNYGTASQSARERSTLSAFDLHTPRPEPSQYTTSSTTFTTSTASRPEPVEEATQPEEEKTEETPENVIRFSGF